MFVLLAAVVSRPLFAQSTELEVRDVAVVDDTITVTGANFGDSPTMILGDMPLVITEVTEKQLVAVLPPLTSGTYMLEVSRDNGTTSQGTARTAVTIP